MHVSIVIPNYNGLEVLKKHIPSVLACMRDGDELIIVDDASNDASVAFLKTEYPQIRVITHVTNKRFGRTCNDGVDQAKHEYVLLLNNDVAPPKDLIGHVLPHFHDPRVAAVGCLEHDSQGVASGKSVARFARGMFVHARAASQKSGYTMWSTAGSMMVRKSIWQKLGGMDYAFRPAYFEDIDLGYRIWKAGYVVRFEAKARVFHDHETTNMSTFGDERIQVMSYKNGFLFMWKNVTDVSIFLSHICWLPYHLIIGGYRSHGLLILGFIQATLQLTEVMISRWNTRKYIVLSDREVMKKYENLNRSTYEQK